MRADAVTCDVVAETLPAIVDGTDPPRADVSAHVEACLRCQAELVQYRKLLKALRVLRTEVLEPAPGLLSDILVSLGEAGERRAVRATVRGRRIAYVGGIAAATAAGAGAAIVLASRARHRKMGLAG